MTSVNAAASGDELEGGAAAATAESDLKALTEAFEQFTKTTASMEESYRRLEARIQSLDQELQEKNRQLSLATEYLDAILDSMSDGVIAVNTEGVVTTFNRAAAAILGHAPEDVVGRPYAEAIGREGPAAAGPQVRERVNRSGERVPVSEKAAPISDRGGDELGTVHVFQDLSELEALREEVRRKDRLAALGQMAATVAHEIRNPLGGIRGFAALLERDIDEDDPRRRLVEKILSGTMSLDRVVNELLEYTRPVELEVGTHACRDLAEAALGYLEKPRAGVTIQNEIPADLAVRVDGQKVRQVLLNVLLNAVQSLDGGGSVALTAQTEGAWAVIAVSDTGCGIDAAELDKVFMPFYTTREKGTGLGLAVAAKTVESHGGSMQVTSRPGEGSTFRIRLPLAEGVRHG